MANGLEQIPGMASRPLTSSLDLGWKTVQAITYADPPEAEEFQVRPGKLLLVLVTSGRYDLDRREGGGWFTDAREPGSLCVVLPNEETRVRWRTTSDQPMRSLHVQIDASAPVIARVPDQRHLQDPFLVAGAWTLSQALGSGAPALYADSVAQALTAHLVFRTTRSAPPPGLPPAPLSAHQIDRITEYMREHLADNVSVDDLAAVVSVSKYHFIRTFATTTGLTPYRYLRRLRVQVGASLLRTTRQPVSAVAARCGYQNSSHFAAAFRSEYGVSPNRFRGDQTTYAPISRIPQLLDKGVDETFSPRGGLTA